MTSYETAFYFPLISCHFYYYHILFLSSYGCVRNGQVVYIGDISQRVKFFLFLFSMEAYMF
jgi:hypothetical protein